ncbi:MAG: response regulator [Candidatus Rokubacteria bacterium]|nr:response regulator [Candidatus Rokubacteria bacterium]MBI3824732.1 response regulator [Candidatus Rokubacteria bacterium]
MRVLVVEDQPEVGEVFVDSLLELGHQPSLARSAEAALGQLETERLDVIILDLSLPGLSGLDFLQLRPVRAAGVPVVAMSGVATESQARECLRLGALDFVGKPVAVTRLAEILAFIEPHALDRRQRAADEGPERRRSRHVRARLPVRVQEYDGSQWEGTSVDVSPSGMKVRAETRLEKGVAARLVFTPPDGGPAVDVMSLLVRADADGQAFYFVNLTSADFDRLKTLTER